MRSTSCQAAMAILLAALGYAALAPQAVAQEWTRFRGPNGSGVSDAETIPATWTEKDFNWRIALPGPGHSHPVLWGNKLFVTSAANKGNTRIVLCVDADNGKILWQKPYDLTAAHKHNLNSFASSTPACDAEHVYVAFANPEHYYLVALDHDGNEKWKHDLGPFESQHGDGSSPIVWNNFVIIGNEQDGTSFLLALDRLSGKVVWQTPRRATKVSYSTPCVYEAPNQAPQLIFNSQSYGVSSVDARTGQELWEAPLFTMRSCSSPVLAGDALLGTCGSGGGGNYLIAIKPGGKGDVSKTHLAYRINKASMVPYVPTPVTHGDLLFLWTEKGIVSCVKVSDGSTVWSERVGGNFWASPIRIRDKLYSLSDAGECVILSATDKYEVLAKNPVGEGSHSSIAVANGALYVRTFEHLVSIGGKK